MNKKAAAYIFRVILQKLLGLLMFLIGSGWALDFHSSAYFFMYILLTGASCYALYRINPETLARRGDIKTNSPLWDKILLFVLWLVMYFLVYLAAGFGYDPSASAVMFWVGLGLCAASGIITLFAMIENTYLESTARLQSDRAQTVCTTGPYSVVRHPAYSAILLWCVGAYLVFPSLWVGICCAVAAVITVVRTVFEDNMLMAGLSGYQDYAQSVPYRLVPFVW